MQSAVVRVLVVDDVAADRLHRVAEVAEVLGVVVVHTVDRALDGAAAIGHLGLGGGSGLLLGELGLLDGARDAEAGLHDVGVHAVDQRGVIVAQRADARVDAVEHLHHGLVVEARLKFLAGRRGATAAVSGAVTSAERAVTSPAEQQGQQDDPPTVAITETVVVPATGNGSHVGGAEVIRSERNSSSLIDIFGFVIVSLGKSKEGLGLLERGVPVHP